MKITFPYMGTTIIYKKMLEMLGHEVIMPPPPSQRTIDLGVKYSPEFVCFPFKVIMGSYIEAIELGADTVVTSGGDGPCRAGYYGEVHQRILQNMGYDINFIIFDSMFRDYKDFFRKLMVLKGQNSLGHIIHTLLLNYRMICSMDDFEKRTKIIRAYEIHRGDVTKAWKQIKDTFANAYTEDAFRKAVKEGSELFQSIELRPIIEEERIRVGISGEIYVAMEPAVNMDIEERLGDMGVEVENCQYISDWVRHNARPKWAGKSHAQKLVDKGARYIPIGLGGHEQENIGAIVDYAERGFDGAVHLLPFGCLPELFTQSTLPIVSKKLDMPILSLSIDEQTGRANSLTRLEAFVDLIKNKRFDKKAAV